MSLHRLSAGAGYSYLLRHTACGDVQRATSTPLTAYYTESGYPPGRWFGKGVPSLGLTRGSLVTEPQMARLFGTGKHPTTGAPLGRTYPAFTSLADRISTRINALPNDLDADVRADLTTQIRASESKRPSPGAVAGFDLTFTVPKSVSVLWAVADEKTQAAISEAHQAALADALAFFEDRALFTRTGSAGCAQVRTSGLVASAFDHWDTRTGDPNLHTHVVIANKVQGPDGKWRSLDSRALHHAAVAVSELYDNLVADQLGRRLPVSWSLRDRGDRRTPAFEVDGVGDVLLEAFSTRSAQVDIEMRALVSAFTAEHGRGPTRVDIIQMRQQATRSTRPEKTLRPLPELMKTWRDRAVDLTGQEPEQLARSAMGADLTPRTFAEVEPETLDALVEATLFKVMQRRSTWTSWNIMTETQRATRLVRMATPADRLALADAVTERVIAASLALDPPDLITVPSAYLDADGKSVFSRQGEKRFTHPRILDAEERLLQANQRLGAPEIPAYVAERIAQTPQVRHNQPPVRLADDQADAFMAIATSGRLLEVLVGPAGTGKTTTLSALRSAWESTHGVGSVVGLAPSATAAHELSAALSVHCENTAKWLYETKGDGWERRQQALAAVVHRLNLDVDSTTFAALVSRKQELQGQNDHWRLRPGQLLIVDEASLAGTLQLDELLHQAEAAEAKVLLVGDHRQLTAVDAGGAFGLLAEKGSASELRSLWRFRNRWEADASRRVRRGDIDVLEEYASRERIMAGAAETIVEAAYLGWQESDRAGEATLLVAADGTSVDELNRRAHEDRIAAGLVQPLGVTLGNRAEACVGDRVVTRRNDRSLLVAGHGHVRNGSLWTVVATGSDGSLTVTPADKHVSHGCQPDPSAITTLPATYVAEHVELGYATTAHRAQGLTVDSCHTLVAPGMTREAFYVAMTRGRRSNIAYVATDGVDPSCEEIPDTHAVRTGRQVLEQVLGNVGAELSATQTMERQEREATSLKHLIPIRDTLAADADVQRWLPALDECGLTMAQIHSVTQSDARGALLAALRRGEQRGLPMEELLQRAVASRCLDGHDGARDIAAVLHERLDRLIATTEPRAAPLRFPSPVSDDHAELRQALKEYDQLIEQRLAQEAATLAQPEPWDEEAWLAAIEEGEQRVLQR